MHAIARAAVAVAAIVALAACGDTGPEPDDAPAGAGFPVAIEHKFGTTEIPSRPERVVTVGFTEQDALLALGITPVGEREFGGGYAYRDRPWAQEALDGAEPATVGGDEISFERVAAQRPDLIIGVNSGMTEDEYRRLSDIAPTVAQSDEYIDFGVPWQEQTMVIGRAVGREDEARALVRDVEARFARARDEHPEFAGTRMVLGYGAGGNFGAHTSRDYRAQFFEDLGFEPDERVDELAGDSFFIDFDDEQFRLLEQELLVMYATRAAVTEDPVVGRLDAVDEERVVYLDLEDQFAGALGFSSPLSLPYLLDEAVPKLAAAADGDPGTTAPEPR